MSPPIILDFEASSLSDRSYPIEVAWTLDGETIEEHLISPTGVEDWTEWSPKAEATHGISQATLLRDGKNVRHICDRISAALSGKTVHTDNPDYDREWMRRLFRACYRQEPLIDWQNLLHLPPLASLSPADRATLGREARALAGPAHRAATDVRWAINLLQLAENRQ